MSLRLTTLHEHARSTLECGGLTPPSLLCRRLVQTLSCEGLRCPEGKAASRWAPLALLRGSSLLRTRACRGGTLVYCLPGALRTPLPVAIPRRRQAAALQGAFGTTIFFDV